MKILVLHNNNVPFFLRSNEDYQLKEGINIHSVILKYESNISNQTYDSFICGKLSFLKDEQFDIIISPYSFNRDNYMEYSGLRVATHIRLTKEWHHLTVPILFLGPDDIDDMIKLSDFASILTSYRVFMYDKHEEDDIESIIRETVRDNQYDSDTEKQYHSSRRYAKMVYKLRIKTPANYATHHSVANEWAIHRWIDMIKWGGKVPEVKDKSILEQLYFKCLIAKVAILDGVRESFSKKYKKNNPTSPIISGIEGKRIIYFDDEGDKGWYSLLGCIFEESKAKLNPFPVDKGKSVEQMLQDAQLFADKNPGDCYLIDLRLHDDDFGSDVKPNELSGYKLADYIKNDKENGNKGRQVVFFSASNKIWNYEEIQSGIGRCSFIVKESPEYNYTRKETDANFCDFKNAIKTAIDKSYISDYVNILKHCQSMRAQSWNALNQFVDMLLYDEKGTVKYNVLNLYVFIDGYLSNKYSLDASHLLLNTNSSPLCDFNPQFVIIDKRERNDGYKHIRFRKSIFERYDSRNENTLDITQNSEFPVVMVALRYYYKMSEENCNKVQRLRTERNRCVAHNGGETNLSISDLRDIFESIVVPIIKKDFGIH